MKLPTLMWKTGKPAPEPAAMPAGSGAEESPPPPPPVASTTPGTVDPVRVLAAVLAAGSVVFTGWKIWDLIAGPTAAALMHLVGVSTGLAVEAAWLMMLALAYQQATRTGQVSLWVTLAGWSLAIGAAAILVLHGLQTGTWVFALLGLLPLMAKTAWHGLTHIRAQESLARLAQAAQDAAAQRKAAQERAAAQAAQAEQERERSAALSTELTDQEQRQIAELRRQANFARQRAQAEKEVTQAEAEADRLRQEAEADADRTQRKTESQMRQEAIEHKAQEQMALQKANADLLKQRRELELELQLMRPYEIGQGGGVRVPDNASSIDTADHEALSAGFGGAFTTMGATPVDLRVPPGATPGATPAATGVAGPGAATPSEGEQGHTWPKPGTPEQGRRQLIEYARWRLEQGKTPSLKDAAERMHTTKRSIARYRDTLEGDYPELMAAFPRPQS